MPRCVEGACWRRVSVRQARGCSSVGRPHDRLTQGMPVPETSLARRGRLHLHPLATCTGRLLRSPHVAAGHVDAEPDTSSPDPERRSNPSSFILWCGRAAVVCGDVRLALNGALLLVNSGGAGLVHTGTGDAKEGEPGTPKGRSLDGRRATASCVRGRRKPSVSTALARTASCNHAGGNHDWETTTSQGGG